jgi:hypothetical protein
MLQQEILMQLPAAVAPLEMAVALLQENVARRLAGAALPPIIVELK